MTTDRKETDERPIIPGTEITSITLLAIFTVMFLFVSHISDSNYQTRCLGYEEQIETSLKQTMAGENELHLIQARFQLYKRYCTFY